MDKLFSLLSIAEARRVLVGTELNVNTWSDEQTNNAVMISLHCMLNGPVGVNKVTTFPVVGVGSIKSKVDSSATNRTWANTVRLIALHIKAQPAWSQVILDSQQHTLHGDIWPLWDRKPSAL